MLGGKLAAAVVAERAAGVPYTVAEKEIVPEIYERAAKATPKAPPGVLGEGAIAFGAGAVLSTKSTSQLQQSDPQVLIKTN